MTGSRPSGPAFRRLYKTWLLLASIGHGAKGPSSLPPLFSQCESHGPPIGVGREKNWEPGQSGTVKHEYRVEYEQKVKI